MAERKPTGMTLAEHRSFAAALEELDVIVHRYPVPQKQGAIQGQVEHWATELRSEMDEYAFCECLELPEQQRLEVYYPHDERPEPEACSLDRVRVVLLERIVALSAVDPSSKAVVLARALLERVDSLAAFEKAQASPGRP